MERFDDLPHLLPVIFADKVNLVDNKSRTELDLLDKETFDVLLAYLVLLEELFSRSELVDKTHCVDNAYDVVENTVLDGQKLLCYRHGLADTAGFDHDVVIFSGSDDPFDVLCHLALERAAYTAVRKRHYVLCVGDVCSLCNEGGIDVYFADIINDNGHLISFLVPENVVQKGCLSRPQITA